MSCGQIFTQNCLSESWTLVPEYIEFKDMMYYMKNENEEFVNLQFSNYVYKITLRRIIIKSLGQPWSQGF